MPRRKKEQDAEDGEGNDDDSNDDEVVMPPKKRAKLSNPPEQSLPGSTIAKDVADAAGARLEKFSAASPLPDGRRLHLLMDPTADTRPESVASNESKDTPPTKPAKQKATASKKSDDDPKKLKKAKAKAKDPKPDSSAPSPAPTPRPVGRPRKNPLPPTPDPAKPVIPAPPVMAKPARDSGAREDDEVARTNKQNAAAFSGEDDEANDGVTPLPSRAAEDEDGIGFEQDSEVEPDPELAAAEAAVAAALDIDEEEDDDEEETRERRGATRASAGDEEEDDEDEPVRDDDDDNDDGDEGDNDLDQTLDELGLGGGDFEDDEDSPAEGFAEDDDDEMGLNEEDFLKRISQKKKMKMSSMTARQRAQVLKQKGHTVNMEYMEIAAKGRKRNETEDDLVTKNEKSRRRKILQDKKQEEEKRLIVDKLLQKKVSSRTREKVKEERVFKTLDGPAVRTLITATGTTVSFPENHNASLFAHAPPRRPRALCGRSGCGRPRTYADAATGTPLCSLECYRLLRGADPVAPSVTVRDGSR